MKTLQRNDHLTISISQRSTRPKTLQHNSLPIPVDLVIDIFSRLPAKSVARCRCVSKQWRYILRLQDFTELFLTRSSSLPQLLFFCRDNMKLCLFSAPHVQDSCTRVTNHHMKIPFLPNAKMCGSVRGLVCLTYPRRFKGRKETMHVICNPSTGQSLTLPKVNTEVIHGLFGYDPIENQYKVFTTSRFPNRFSPRELIVEHKVFTLGTKKPSWRKVNCCEKHYPLSSSGVCIDGVLYYVATMEEAVMEKDLWSGIIMIVCFDVRTEKFSYIKSGVGPVGMDLTKDSILVNYKGKLGTLLSELQGYIPRSLVSRDTKSFEMWVLEDTEKLKWSQHVCIFPSIWKYMVGAARLYFVGVVGLNEIVLAPRSIFERFYVFYYNIENKIIRRVEIQGLNAFKNGTMVYTSVDHVEQVEMMEMFKTYNLRSCNKS